MADVRTARSGSLVACLFGLLVAAPSLAASSLPNGDVPCDEGAEVPLGEVVVVGRRAPEPLFDSDRSVSVLDARALAERAPRTLPEALEEAPGVYVQKTNHAGGSPMIRGLVGPQNLILFDGVRLNNSLYRTGPLQYLNLVDPLALSRVEVLRGPGAVLYGSDAMGGVVQAFPLVPEDARGVDGVLASGSALLRYGSSDFERTGHARGNVAWGGFGLVAAGSYKQFGDLDGGGDLGAQPWSSYDHGSFLASAMWRFDDGGPLAGWWLQTTYLLSRMPDQGRADRFYSHKKVQVYDDEDDLLYARLHARLAAICSEGDLTLSYQRFFERQDSIDLEDDLETQKKAKRDESTAHTLGVDLALTTTLLDDRLRLRYGGTWYRDWVGADQLARTGDAPFVDTGITGLPTDATYDLYGLFALVEGEPLSSAAGHVLRLAGGYRLHGAAGHAVADGVLPAVDYSFLGHVFLGSLSYLYADHATVALTFSQGFRAPNLFESLKLGDVGDSFHVPNTSGLGPESSDTLELVARGRVWRLTLEATGYVSFLHDLIEQIPTTYEGETEREGKKIVEDANAGEALVWGVEGRLALDIGWGLSVWGSLTYTWGEKDAAGGSDEPVSRIPPLFGQGAVRYQAPCGEACRFFVETYVQGAAEQDRLSQRDKDDVRIGPDGTPAWWTWNLRAGVTLPRRLAITASVENLLDAKYKMHGSGIYGAGVATTVALEAFF